MIDAGTLRAGSNGSGVAIATPPSSLVRARRGFQDRAVARPFALMLGSAALYVASFPPVGCWVLAWGALAPLLVAARSLSPTRAAGLGVLWTSATAVGLAWWFPRMVADYFGVPIFAGWATLAGVTLVTACAPIALFAAWVSWAARRNLTHPLLVAAAWTATEIVRVQTRYGNPWGLLAVSQVPALPIAQVAALVGPFGVGFLVVTVNAWIALAVSDARRPHVARSGAMVAILVASSVGYGTLRMSRLPTDDAPGLHAAAVQPAGRGALPLAATARAIADGAALVVWPEYALDAAPLSGEPARTALREVSRTVDLIVGAPSTAWEPSGPRPRNSVYLVRNGRIAGRVDKRRLLPVAEDDYLPGRTVRTLRTTAGRVGVIVCGEALFADTVRAVVDGGAEILALVASDRWFDAPEPLDQMLAHTALRAIESGRWIVRSAGGGVSAIVDPAGRVVARVAFGQDGAAVAAIHPRTTRTVYTACGDTLAWLAVAVVVALSVTTAFLRRSQCM